MYSVGTETLFINEARMQDFYCLETESSGGGRENVAIIFQPSALPLESIRLSLSSPHSNLIMLPMLVSKYKESQTQLQKAEKTKVCLTDALQKGPHFYLPHFLGLSWIKNKTKTITGRDML